MLEVVRAYWEGRTPLLLAKDALDIFLVYYLAYRALLVLRGTRAMQVGVGLSLVFVLYLVAQFLRLVTVISVMGALISSMLLIIVVVFQSDIRRGLQRVGSRAWFGNLARAHEAFDKAAALAAGGPNAERVARERLRVVEEHGSPEDVGAAIDALATVLLAAFGPAGPGSEPGTTIYLRARAIADLSAEYRLTRRYGIFVTGRNVNSADEDTVRYGPSTPADKVITGRINYGPTWYVGVKGTF